MSTPSQHLHLHLHYLACEVHVQVQCGEGLLQQAGTVWPLTDQLGICDFYSGLASLQGEVKNTPGTHCFAYAEIYDKTSRIQKDTFALMQFFYDSNKI